MTYSHVFDTKLIKKLDKLVKKDKRIVEYINKKVNEIIQNPEHYKPLKNELKGIRRAHIGHFVLTFEIRNNIIIFLDFDHHDNIYQK